ncbi:MAG TPA: alcohol dehydrogenase catalytic domain-containing protein [Candidatus Binatia bacterium]
MAGTMKAGRFHGSGQPIHIDEIPVPDIRRNEVLVRVRRAGTNGGDVHLRRGLYDKYVPRPPFTMGHEGLGEVVEVGPEAKGVRVGDRVIVRPNLTCGTCKFCRSEREHRCIRRQVIGWLCRPELLNPRCVDGMWAEYCRIPDTNVHRLEPGDDIDRYSLVSVIAVGYRALKRARMSPGDAVIINGATGVTGVPTVLAAMALGAAHVIAVARNESRLSKLKELDPGRISTVSTKNGPVTESIMELTRGQGASVVVDLVPDTNASLMECIRALEPCGRVALLAAKNEPVQLTYHDFLMNSVEITSSNGRNYQDIAELVELTRHGAIDPTVITARFFALEQADEAIDAVDRRITPEPCWPMMRID